MQDYSNFCAAAADVLCLKPYIDIHQPPEITKPRVYVVKDSLIHLYIIYYSHL